MTYIISKTCVGLKDGSCVDVCPVEAIYAEEDVPKDEEEYIDKNYKYFNLER